MLRARLIPAERNRNLVGRHDTGEPPGEKFNGMSSAHDSRALAAQFVEGVIAAVYRAAVEGTIRVMMNPPGSEPDRRLIDLGNWYRGLSPPQQERAQRLIAFAVDSAVLGMLTALDGSRRVLPQAAGTEELVLELKSGNQWRRINEGAPLHDLYRAAISPFGEPPDAGDSRDKNGKPKAKPG